MTRRRLVASAAVAALTIVLCGSALAAGTVVTLRPALMTGANAPHGFDANAGRIFTTLVSKMPVAGKTCGTKSLKRSDWKQGIHQVFKKFWPPTVDEDDLELCGYLFTTNGPAVSNFRTTQTTVQQALSRHLTRVLPSPAIGDGVIAGISPFKQGTGGYFLVFHYRNALMSLSYIYHRTPLLTTSAFVHLATTMAKRLERGY